MRPLFLTLVILLGSFGIASCDHIQGDREVETDPQAIPKGPGLLTGRKGHWTILGK
jgi:hypothetical protein